MSRSNDATLVYVEASRQELLDLSEDDKSALGPFLHTLTDDAMLNDSKFSNPFP